MGYHDGVHLLWGVCWMIPCCWGLPDFLSLSFLKDILDARSLRGSEMTSSRGGKLDMLCYGKGRSQSCVGAMEGFE